MNGGTDAAAGREREGSHSKLPAVGDDDVGLGFAALAAVRLQGVHQLQPLHHLSKHHVLPIEPARTHKQVSEQQHTGHTNYTTVGSMFSNDLCHAY